MKQRYNQRLKNIIDFTLLKESNVSLTTLTNALKKEGIDCVLRTSKQGFIYGITYIDHRNKCVFKGSDLGKQYSAKVIQERCALHKPYQQFQTNNLTPLFGSQNEDKKAITGELLKLADDLFKPEINSNSSEPFEIKRFKKKKSLRQG